MNESEVLEIVNLYASNGMHSLSIWATFTFACLTAAYLAGDRLSRFQVIVVSSLYFVAAGAFAKKRFSLIQTLSLPNTGIYRGQFSHTQ
jgi:hypothetical protein